jgi:hypothetical protein
MLFTRQTKVGHVLRRPGRSHARTAPPAMYQDRPRALCTWQGRAGPARTHPRVFMVRLKVAVAAGVLAGGLAMPSAASADSAQVVYAWGDNSQARPPEITVFWEQNKIRTVRV